MASTQWSGAREGGKGQIISCCVKPQLRIIDNEREQSLKIYQETLVNQTLTTTDNSIKGDW